MPYLSTMTAAEVAAHLSRRGSKTEKTRTGYKVCCPAHPDRTPSLNLTDSSDHLLWHCFAGCDPKDVQRELQAIVGDDGNRSGGHEDAKPQEKRIIEDPWESLPEVPDHIGGSVDDFQHFKHGAPSKIWTYRRENGRIAGWIARYDTAEGGKEIIPYSWCINRTTGAEELRTKAMADPRPLYRLEHIRSNPGATIFMHEGEKSADAGQMIIPSWISTAISGGGNAWKLADFRPLEGRHVVILADHDGPGHQFAHGVASRLYGKASLRLMVWPQAWPDSLDDPARAGKPYPMFDGDDAADHHARGWNADLIRQFCAEKECLLTYPFMPIRAVIAG